MKHSRMLELILTEMASWTSPIIRISLPAFVTIFTNRTHNVFLLGLLILPFIFWPFTTIPFEIPKVWFVWLWIEILLILVATHIVWKKNFIAREGFITLLFLLLSSALLSSIINHSVASSFMGNPFRLDGIFTLIHLLLLAFISHTYLDLESFLFMLKKVWKCNIILVALGYAHWVQWIWEGVGWASAWEGNIGVTFGQPNFLAGYLLLTLPIGLHELIHANTIKERVFHILLIILTGLLLFVTDSQGALLGVPLTGLVFFFLFHKKMLWAVLTVLLCITIFVSANLYLQRETPSPESRTRLYYTLGAAILDKPVFGWGYAQVSTAFKANPWLVERQHDVYVDKAHSHFLETFVTLGTVGGFVYLGFIGYVLLFARTRILSSPWKTHSTYIVLSCMLLVFLYHAQTNVLSINEEVYFWILVGILTKKKLPARAV